ncbi:MAG: M20/M25/M40 family metallo-hydrolase [Cyclobacteriaceae bacterium]|nr:M20/M25/M40 family metallo-hydrolase [Cyclobacteriaceae bacterium]
MKNLLPQVLLVSFILIETSVYAFQKLNIQTEATNRTTVAAAELMEFIAIPNDANNLSSIEKNVAWLEDAFSKRGFETKVLKTENTPLFFAEIKVKKAKSTLLFYMHYDGQAVDPSKWQQEDPYQAVVKEKKENGWSILNYEMGTPLNSDWRIFGRSASDDKGPIVMLLHAMDLINANKLKLTYNIKVVLDGEEEKSSKQLGKAVVEYKDLLAADHLIINDGPMHLSGQSTIIYGCRGITGLVLTMYGPRTHQHSGHYGNYAPNPVFRMSSLLASMKDEEGRVTIPEYYDGINLTDDIKEILARVPDEPATIHQIIGIAEPEKVGNNYQESLQYPSLNVRGFSSAWTGPDTRTIVPESATASIDIRLVPESEPERLKDLIEEHIRNQGYHIVYQDPTEEERLKYSHIIKIERSTATLPFRTDMDSESGQLVAGAIKKGLGVDPVQIRIMGGTVPVSSFINALKVPAMIVPLVNADNNQHSPNENLRVGNISNGIATFVSILTYR